MFKSGFVGIVGKPNVGKSTLVNKLVGYKVAITAPKPQTTRFNIKGIITTETSQVIFVDTPGIHTPKDKLGKYMMENVTNAYKDVDCIVYMVDATKPRLDDISKEYINQIFLANNKVILCINKVEEVKKEFVFETMKIYTDYALSIDKKFADVIPISVYKGTNLDELKNSIENLLPNGDMLYSADDITDMTEREIVEEIIREKALRNLNEEVPHGVNVEVISFKERNKKDGTLIYDIEVNIICEKESHKPIILGKEGRMLKKIMSDARHDIEENLDTKVNLKTWVKVREKWQDNDNFLKNIKRT